MKQDMVNSFPVRVEFDLAAVRVAVVSIVTCARLFPDHGATAFAYHVERVEESWQLGDYSENLIF